jgi:hypothetical protein
MIGGPFAIVTGSDFLDVSADSTSFGVTVTAMVSPLLNRPHARTSVLSSITQLHSFPRYE